MAQLDLRPAPGTMIYELLRLGLVFDNRNGDLETWCIYQYNLKAVYSTTDPTKVTFTDLTTHLDKQVNLSDLPGIDSIITWKSDDPTKTTTTGSNQN